MDEKHTKLGVGTFIVREDAAADLEKTLGRLARIGYDGVELLGFFGKTAKEIRPLLQNLNIHAFGDHVPVTELLTDPQRVIEAHLEVGCAYMTLSLDKEVVVSQPFDRLAEQYEAAVNFCLQGGITPLYHNHDFDMQGDAPFTECILDTVRELRFEPDLGWMIVAGKDPAQYITKYQNRIRVVHLKDVFMTEEGFVFRPTGYGITNTPALLPMIQACKPDWLMVDHDLAYERDSYDDLRLSYEYVRALLRVAS